MRVHTCWQLHYPFRKVSGLLLRPRKNEQNIGPINFTLGGIPLDPEPILLDAGMLQAQKRAKGRYGCQTHTLTNVTGQNCGNRLRSFSIDAIRGGRPGLWTRGFKDVGSIPLELCNSGQ